jgi:asparagine synthase (glutamine-hydrolysing)
MCGIVGIYNYKLDRLVNVDVVIKMCDAIAHRGPDDRGIYISPDKRLCFGHTRLSIIDLSPAGHQPMPNRDRSIWISYNGEIYNYLELRNELKTKSYEFKSNSDTEVIIHAYKEWGIEGLLERLRGMFAFAIYDSRPNSSDSRLILARDRLGIKPLYYVHKNRTFVFASEIKAILASGLIQQEINLKGAGHFLLNGSIPPPDTIYKEIFSLEPGHFLIVGKEGITKRRYYNLINAFLDTSFEKISEKESIEEIRACLLDTVKCHLVSDVPVGAFLSGGIDSSSIVSLMRGVEHKPIKTVSVIFPDTPYDESRYAKIVAQKFNTDHVEVKITGKDLINHLEKIFYIMEQPTIDGVNSYFVSWATKQAGLKVVMSGIGGDEIFWGYPSFTQIPKLYGLLKVLSMVPLGKKTAGFFLKNSNSSQRAKLYSMLSNNSSIPGIYLNFRGLFTREQIQKLLHPDFIKEATEEIEPYFYFTECPKISSKFNQVSLLETTSYMSNQLLRDTDVFSMTHSLEVRVPFADHQLVELLARIPVKYKFGKDVPKGLLIKALNNKLPEEIIHRPKMGFTFPFNLWMRNELKGLIEERLNSSTVFNSHFIKGLLNGYSGNRVHWSRVWGCFVLSHWLE